MVRRKVDDKTSEYRFVEDWVVWATLGLIVGAIAAFAFIMLTLQGVL